jgi:hypothetical protein
MKYNMDKCIVEYVLKDATSDTISSGTLALDEKEWYPVLVSNGRFFKETGETHHCRKVFKEIFPYDLEKDVVPND